jgi:RNA polymerase sigma-70 factor (ECF subfamily)
MKEPNDCPYRRQGESPGTTGTSLLNGLRGDEPKSWERLIRDYAPLVFRWALSAGLHPEDAVGVGQEVFQGIAAGLDSFRRDEVGQTFRGWVRQITRYRAVDFLRRNGEEPRGAGGEERPEHLERMFVRDEVDENSLEMDVAVELAIGIVRAEFEPRTWRAFEQTVMEDHPTQVVADELGMSAAAVYVARSRVQKRLRQVLDEVTADDLDHPVRRRIEKRDSVTS